MENLLHAFTLRMNIKKDMPHWVTLSDLNNCHELDNEILRFWNTLKFFVFILFLNL